MENHKKNMQTTDRKSNMKHKVNSMSALVATLIAFGSLAGGANAAVVINVIKDGSGVQIVGTGSIDLNSVTSIGSGSDSYAFNAINSNGSYFVGLAPEQHDVYSIANVTAFGDSDTSSPFTLNISGNRAQGVFVSSFIGGILVPSGYVSNAALDFTASISNYDYTSFGYSAGDSFTISWSKGAFNDSLTMNFGPVPEPSSSLLLGFGVLGVLSRRRRNK